jgi:hypothetical protein
MPCSCMYTVRALTIHMYRHKHRAHNESANFDSVLQFFPAIAILVRRFHWLKGGVNCKLAGHNFKFRMWLCIVGYTYLSLGNALHFFTFKRALFWIFFKRIYQPWFWYRKQKQWRGLYVWLIRLIIISTKIPTPRKGRGQNDTMSYSTDNVSCTRLNATQRQFS